MHFALFTPILCVEAKKARSSVNLRSNPSTIRFISRFCRAHFEEMPMRYSRLRIILLSILFATPFPMQTAGAAPAFMVSQLDANCDTIQSRINNLMVEKDSLQEDLSTAAPGEKAFLVAQIRRINAQLIALRNAWRVCGVTHD